MVNDMLAPLFSTAGPFLISCTIGGEDAYWAIDGTGGSRLICGTEHPDEASQFYITPTGDATHPNEFLIAHWVGDRRQRKELQYPLNKGESATGYSSKPVLPLYVSSGFSLGRSNGPLQLKPAVPVHQARFCLHNRVQTRYSFLMCRSTPVSHREWTEGEQFYINCSRQSLLIDGYVAMLKNKDQTFETTTLSFIKESTELGMLFRLNPPPPSAHTANEMTTYSNADMISLTLYEKNEDECELHSECLSEELIEESSVNPASAQTVTAEEVSRHDLQRGLTTHAQKFSRHDPEELIESSVDPPSAQTVTAEEVSRHDLQRGITTHAQQFEQYFGNIDD